ncbi:MAG: GAF domain-containing protein, partial [Nitrospira sp.]|nr:GAF domain-containing protein [Nitrospira sp.]
MIPTTPHSKAVPETRLQRTLTSVLNDLPVEAALAAVFHQEQGPLVAHAARGFTPRDTQAIIRTLSAPTVAATTPESDQEGGRTIRLRLITPGAKSLLGVPLRYRNKTYGFLVVGRKENATFVKKEKALMEQASDEVTKALEREGLFDMNVVLSRPFVAQEPVPPPPSPAELFAAPVSQLTPELQEKIIAALTDANQYVAYDRIWACHYDPLAGNVEVLGMAGDLKSEQKDGKKDLKPGHRLTLDSSASGWAVRHRKPRVDHDLASTQGRFLDHKYLFKDRLLSSLVVPFFVRGQVGGTLTLASKESGRYHQTDARTLEPIIVKLAEILQAPTLIPVGQPVVKGPAGSTGGAVAPG